MNNNVYDEVQTTYIPQTVEKVREKPEYSKAEVVLSVFAFTAAFFIMRYVVFNAMGFLTTGLMFAVITGAIVYMKKRGCSFTRFNRFHAAVLYIFSLVFSITANNFIKDLAVLFILGAGAYLVYSVSAGNREVERYLPFAMCKALFEYPLSHFGKQWFVTQDSLSKTRAGSNVKYILTGLLITVPVTAIVAALLMSADDGLMNILGGIYEKVFSLEMCDIIEQLIFAVPFSMYLFGMLYSNTHRSQIKPLVEENCVQKLGSIRFVSNLVMYTAVTPLCILYVLFFISQANYFLSAFSGSLPDGFTYADYARQGFFELCAVAVINLAVLCGISLLSKKAGREKPAALKEYSIVLSVFTLILIATAMSKMVMYIANYGLTELRVYTSWFMVLLALVFVLIIIKQFRYDMKFAKYFSAVFTLMFAVLCFSRPEAVIAKYNIVMYNTGHLEELDRDAILGMSADGLLAAYDEGALTAEDISEYSEEYSPFDRFGNYNLSSAVLSSKTK